jgi:hypothetical protein
MNDPDWHWRLVLDLDWARSQAIDVNAALPAGNLLNNGIPDPGGGGVRARCGVPQIEVEISGWPIRAEPSRREPPDWGFPEGTDCHAAFVDGRKVKWPFNPKAPDREPLTEASDALRDLGSGQYVRIHGAIVTDTVHIDRNDPEQSELERRWSNGPLKEARNFMRYTEIHPPDKVEIVQSPPWAETIRWSPSRRRAPSTGGHHRSRRST